ncbi:MAG TPA: transglutaminase family protein, partial [Pirellulaceae bacterium]|nr:transglutaminase family protein [Pirellulaceae bacterium]
IFRNLLIDLTGNTHRAEFCIDKLFSPDSSSGRLGLVEFRGFEMPPHAQMSLTQQLLLRALVAKFWEQPYRAKLVDWGTTLHDRFLLPYFAQLDFADVITELNSADLPLDARWFAPHFEFRYPVIGEFTQRAIHVELRSAIEPWYVLGEEATGGGTARFVDSSVERLQVLVQGMTDPRHIVTVNGRRLPLHPTGTAGEYVAGVRYRAWQPPSCLHPTIPSDAPLVFDVLDTWLSRSIGGCTYHVSHPGGLSHEPFPVNSLEAESRRVARFFKHGHTPGAMVLPPDEPNKGFPLTLDLRHSEP